jgi:hypothetical protein
MHTVYRLITGLVVAFGAWTGLAVGIALLIALLANPGSSIVLAGGFFEWLWETAKPVLQPQVLTIIGIWMIWLVLREILQMLQSINAQLREVLKRDRN